MQTLGELFERIPKAPWSEASAESKRLARVARLFAKVAAKTDLWTHPSAHGIGVLLEGLVRRRTNPSLLYRFQGASQPDKVAVIWRDQRRTFRELDDEIDGICGGLQSIGFRRGDRAIFMLKNRPEFVALQPAMSRLGSAGVSISWRSTPTEVAYLVNHSRAKAMFFEQELAPVVSAAMPSFDALTRDRAFAVGGPVEGFTRYEDMLRSHPSATGQGADEEAAVIIYTSGTTGKPKGAVRKFPRDIVEGTLQLIVSSPLRVDDVHLAVLPMYHSAAFAFTNLSHLVGATVVIADDFEPEQFLRDIEHHKITQTVMVPTLLHRVLQLGRDRIWRHDTSTLRAIIAVSAPLSGPMAIAAMDVFGDILYNYYGATETGLNTLAEPADLRASPGTIGRVIPGNEIRLLDDDGRPVARGEVGELFVRGPMMVAGYHDDAAATRSAQRNGLFSVGDLAWIDERGCYHLAGRKRDMVISGGVNVYPAEVEQALLAHPEVAEAAVIGLPDDEWGEVVCAVVVPREAGDEAFVPALRMHCKERLAGPKRPRRYVLVDALPRNATGKVLKNELRDELGKGRLVDKKKE